MHLRHGSARARPECPQLVRPLIAGIVLAACVAACDLLVDRNGLVGGDASSSNPAPCDVADAAVTTLCTQPGWCAFAQPLEQLGSCAGGACENLLDLGGGIADCRGLVVWNGSTTHSTNEVYALDLATNDGWQEVTQPSQQDTGCSTALADGTPRVRMVYDGLTYVEHANAMFLFGGTASNNSLCGTYGDTWTFDLASSVWTQRAPSGDSPPAGFPFTDYDPTTRLVYLYVATASVSAFLQYDYGSDAYTQLSSGNFNGYDSTGRIDPVKKWFLLFGDGQLVGFKTDQSHQYQAFPTSGCDAALAPASPGVAYYADHDTFIVWPNGGTSVYELAFDPGGTTTCTELPQTVVGGGTGPQPGMTNGTYGRFRYLSALKIFALLDSVADRTWTLRF